jgi:hypothetical protein
MGESVLNESNRLGFALDPPPGKSTCRSDARYRRHFLCPACRKGFKGAWPLACPCGKRDLVQHDIAKKCPDCGRDVGFLMQRKCPDCGKSMAEVSKDFRVPRKSDKKTWAKIASCVAALSR